MRDTQWVIGLVLQRGRKWRARSFAVAHARVGRAFACGRRSIVKWAGYKKARIVAYAKPAGYERKCRNCEHALKPQPKRRRRR